MQPSQPFGDGPGLEGPDYLALVIEWEDDVPTLVRPRAPDRGITTAHKLARLLGALGAIAFAVWGLHHLRAAS
jgi:hypothetical protein